MNFRDILNPSINLTDQKSIFAAAEPFPHVVLDNFLAESVVSQVSKDFIEDGNDAWYMYSNPIENKKALNNWNLFPSSLYQVFTQLSSQAFLRELEKLSGIQQLYPDPGLHGGGLHLHPRGGKLNVHLDYSIHPKLKLERRLNLLIYVTPGWQPEWGGELELWSHDHQANRPAERVKMIDCRFNRAVIFDTTCNSWHGLPDPISCPEGVFRRSLALYYLSVPRERVSPRQRALFAPSWEQRSDPAIEALIRKRADVEQSSQVYRT